MPLQVDRVLVHERETLRTLLDMYLHEMSAFDDIELGEDGHMEYAHFSCYWVEPERHPFFVRVKGKLAGFVLAREIESFRGGSIHTIAEFFIMNSYRQLGIGEEIARMVFDMFPGKWQVAVLDENKTARAFWKTVVWRYTGGKLHEFRTNDWEGPIYEFSSPGARPIEPPAPIAE